MNPASDFEDKLTDTAANLQHNGEQAAEDLSSRAKDAWHSAQGQAQQALHESSEYLRENRLPALIGAFVCGLFLGRLFSQRSAPTFTERYIAEPVHRSRDMLLALPLAAVGAMFTRYGRTAAASVKKAVHR
ncbi:MAG: hypothetical protein ABJF10_05420 [Chthoniobacter sp.]|uniref:hypothetical protein n=1 Tax=Chthoniobacter sp. TaxID=2510640 RepID=UPI0032AC5979